MTEAVSARDQLQALAVRLARREIPAPAKQRPAAVLVLFGPLGISAGDARSPVPDDLDVLLLSRATTLSTHAGQIAFPGGRIEPSDPSVTAAALREAEEETGLNTAGVDVLGALPQIPVAASNHLVTPVLAWWRAPSAVRVVDPGESAGVFRVPVADLLDPANRRMAVVHRGGRSFPSPAFLLPGLRNQVVWGFTGMVLARVFDRAGWTRPWDASRTIDPLGGLH